MADPAVGETGTWWAEEVTGVDERKERVQDAVGEWLDEKVGEFREDLQADEEGGEW